MWIERLVSSRLTHAVELTARFAEQRHRVLAENIAAIDLPGHSTLRLDPSAFQDSLRRAFAESEQRGTRKLTLRGNAQVSTDAAGRLVTRPVAEPPANAAFHDGTNARIEELVTGVNENALLYSLATQVLGRRFNGIENAIKGRVS